MGSSEMDTALQSTATSSTTSLNSFSSRPSRTATSTTSSTTWDSDSDDILQYTAIRLVEAMKKCSREGHHETAKRIARKILQKYVCNEEIVLPPNVKSICRMVLCKRPWMIEDIDHGILGIVLDVANAMMALRARKCLEEAKTLAHRIILEYKPGFGLRIPDGVLAMAHCVLATGAHDIEDLYHAKEANRYLEWDISQDPDFARRRHRHVILLELKKVVAKKESELEGESLRRRYGKVWVEAPEPQMVGQMAEQELQATSEMESQTVPEPVLETDPEPVEGLKEEPRDLRGKADYWAEYFSSPSKLETIKEEGEEEAKILTVVKVPVIERYLWKVTADDMTWKEENACYDAFLKPFFESYVAEEGFSGWRQT